MTALQSPFLRKLLAIGLLLVVTAALYAAIVLPLRDAREASREAAQGIDQAMARRAATAARMPTLRRDFAALQPRDTAALGLLAGGNDAIAAAQLQNRIKAVVDASHGELRSTQALAARKEGRFTRITLRTQMALTLPALQAVLYSLESASPYIFIEQIDLVRRQTQVKPGVDEEPILDVRFDAYSFSRAAS